VRDDPDPRLTVRNDWATSRRYAVGSKEPQPWTGYPPKPTGPFSAAPAPIKQPGSIRFVGHGTAVQGVDGQWEFRPEPKPPRQGSEPPNGLDFFWETFEVPTDELRGFSARCIGREHPIREAWIAHKIVLEQKEGDAELTNVCVRYRKR
jgi:hypothetical protein